MKLVTYYADPAEASEARARLREAGIMSEVDSVDPHIMKPSRSGATRVGLWVVHDEQFGDAVRLLENPDHVPKRIIAFDEVNAVESSTDEGLPGSASGLLKTLTTIFLVACLFGLIVYTVIGVFNDSW
jgi:hypothetical protein